MRDANDEEAFDWFVGIDWATSAHQVCVYDLAGEIVSERVVEHTVAALATFVEGFVGLTGNALDRVAVGIEVPRGGGG
jgi:hypothetical protein